MKKQLRFLYRYYITSRRWRKLVNRQTALVLFATLAFLTTLAWTAPTAADREAPRRSEGAASGHLLVMEVSGAIQQATPAPDSKPSATTQAIRVEPTHTPFPPEFYENADQTIGITLAGALLVLIVVLGVLTLMPRKK